MDQITLFKELTGKDEYAFYDFIAKFKLNEEQELWKQQVIKELKIALERVIGPNSFIDLP